MSALSSDALDVSEAGPAGTDDSVDGEADDASTRDANATLPLDGSTSDARSLRDASAGSIPDAGSPRDATREDASGGPVDAAGPIDAPGDVVEGNEASDGLPSTAPCLTGGHVLSVEGDPGSFFFTGTQTDAVGSSWAVEAEEYYALFDGALIEVAPPPSADAGGAGWFLDFNTWNAMTRLQTGVVYDVATVSTAGSFGYGRTCTAATGTFRVDDFEAPDARIGGVSMLLGFTAAFAIECDGYPGVLRGCVHF